MCDFVLLLASECHDFATQISGYCASVWALIIVIKPNIVVMLLGAQCAPHAGTFSPLHDPRCKDIELLVVLCYERIGSDLHQDRSCGMRNLIALVNRQLLRSASYLVAQRVMGGTVSRRS